jgi:response regulator RpfG family c-di-GMP phosphodiesterase
MNECMGKRTNEHNGAQEGGKRRTPLGQLADRVIALIGQSNRSPTEDIASKSADDAVPYVICIDDDADFSWAIKTRLELAGIAVVRAFEGAEGLRTAFRYPASAIILDFEMPDGQGDYILSRLKGNPVTQDLPVFVVTGHRDQGLKRKMLSRGATGFFTKPLSWNEFLPALGKHVALVNCQEATPHSATA